MIIYVCSPLRGDIEANRGAALEYCEYVFNQGHYPIAPHVQLSWLDDDKPEERAEGMRAALAALLDCDEVWVFGDVISEGMRGEINLAKERRIKIRRVRL